MIARPKIDGSLSQNTLDQALPPILAVTREDSNPSLLPKQVGGLGPGCPKTGCPLFLALLSIQELHGQNQHEKIVKMVFAQKLTYLLLKLGVSIKLNALEILKK